MSECNITLLDSTSCSHCTGSELDVVEPVWEKHDYVETLNDRERQTVPNGEQFSTQVSMSDIYGGEESLKLRRRNYGSQN